jgi:hypothetical protein
MQRRPNMSDCGCETTLEHAETCLDGEGVKLTPERMGRILRQHGVEQDETTPRDSFVNLYGWLGY